MKLRERDGPLVWISRFIDESRQLLRGQVQLLKEAKPVNLCL